MSATDPQLVDELNQDATTVEDTEAGNDVPNGDDQVADTTTEDKSVEDRSDDEEGQESSVSRRQRAEIRRQSELKALMEKVALLERIAIGTGKGVSNSVQEPEEAPRIEDFDGRPITEYIEARDRFNEKRIIAKVEQEAKLTVQRERAAAKLEATVREARKELTDWDEVMRQADEEGVQVQPDTAAFLAESDRGPWVAHHLAKNPDLHERLNAMSPVRRLAELGKLEDKFSTKKEEAPVKKVTAAPAKLSTTQGKPALTPTDPAAAARQGYAAWKAADNARRAAAGKK